MQVFQRNEDEGCRAQGLGFTSALPVAQLIDYHKVTYFLRHGGVTPYLSGILIVIQGVKQTTASSAALCHLTPPNPRPGLVDVIRSATYFRVDHSGTEHPHISLKGGVTRCGCV